MWVAGVLVWGWGGGVTQGGGLTGGGGGGRGVSVNLSGRKRKGEKITLCPALHKNKCGRPAVKKEQKRKRKSQSVS